MHDTINVDDLAARVQALPAEIYSHIYNLTFTYTSGDVHIIRDNFRPDSRLHIDRNSRNRFAERYYGGSKFHIHSADMKRWIASVDHTHFEMVRNIRMVDVKPMKTTLPVRVNLLWSEGGDSDLGPLWDFFCKQDTRLCILFMKGRLKVPVELQNDGQIRWVSFAHFGKAEFED